MIEGGAVNGPTFLATYNIYHLNDITFKNLLQNCKSSKDPELLL